MSKAHFRNIDLNLLIPLKALLHERNVTRAAKRIHLSQSAMSRALDRLRSELGDELLVRVGRNYELTPRGTALISELGQIMPRLARLWEGEPFSPAQSEARIRLAMTDDASSVVLPQLAEILGRLAPGITLEVVPWHERTHEDNLATQLILSPLAAPANVPFRAFVRGPFRLCGWPEAQTRQWRNQYEGVPHFPPRLNRDTTEPAESDRSIAC